MSLCKTIVFIDDESDFHFITKIKLSQEVQTKKINLACFDNPLNALEFISEQGYSITAVFTDLKMGKLDGFGVISRIHAKFPKLPCYVISAYDSNRCRERAKDLAVSGFMEKPIDYAKLLEVIDSISPSLIDSTL